MYIYIYIYGVVWSGNDRESAPVGCLGFGFDWWYHIVSHITYSCHVYDVMDGR